jgi:hypothetical protein
MSDSTVTIHKTVRGVPLRIEYEFNPTDGPSLCQVFVGDIKVWPASDCRAVLRWFEHRGLEAMHEDFADVEKSLDQEAIDRLQDEEQNQKREDNSQFGVGE